MNSNVTFVTCYIKIYNNDYHENKSFNKRLDFFIKLLELDINICIFISPEYFKVFDELSKRYNNIRIIQVLSINDLSFSKIVYENNFQNRLPERKNNSKDTTNYMILMNSKIEFIYKSISQNPFNSEYFCWIDFSLPYIFKDIEKTMDHIKIISQCKFINYFLTMPGCWNVKVDDINYIKDNICWRFCGGIFFGDKKSLKHFYELSIDNFYEFLTQTNSLVWEVNYWAWLETNKNFNPIWYCADHDDSIVKIPHHLYSVCVK